MVLPQATGRVLARRNPTSLVGMLRSTWRSFESHPFERLPVTQQSAPADWGRQVRRLSSQTVVFFPAMFFMLGWPWFAKKAFDAGSGYEVEGRRLGYDYGQ